MIYQRLLSAFALGALLSGANAGPCRPKSSTSITATSTETASTTAFESSSTANETISPTATETASITTTQESSTETTETFTTTETTSSGSTTLESTTTTSSAEPTVTEYLRNGDFDKTSNVFPWTFTDAAESPLLLGIASGLSHEGGHSMRLKFDGQVGYFLRNTLDASKLHAEIDYELSAWVKFDKEKVNGEGCELLYVWCFDDKWSYAEKAGNGVLNASPESTSDFVQVKATCRWTEAQLKKTPNILFKFQCSKTLAWIDSVQMTVADQ
ncbi:hypothetical protein NM208_g4912 [Fusarium decemcellulare]|uniref:Uncharacterized protein n=1 Tax=Fusarium decemcellulare TaxID=57161 RepID=A0ACC1SJ16_9HYPO|nr:hypothetical protein NM208_g4912 [Fusarium decemcellulare]